MVALQQQFSEIAVQTGQEFFRLNQALESSGDIFEINSGVKALAIGPESDVADIVIDFFDQQQQTNIGQVIISPQSPFIGRLDALLGTQIPLSTTKARIFATTRDLIDNTYLPRTFDSVGPNEDLLMARVRPSIDLLAYLSNPALLPQGRADRLYQFPYVQTGNTNVGWVILPYYGRRFAHLNFMNLDAAVSYTVQLFGVCLSVGTTAPGGATKQSETLLGTTGAIAPGATGNIVVTPALGVYDLLEVRFQASAPMPQDFNSTLRVLVSDRAA